MAFEKFVLLPKDHVIVQKTQFHYVSHYTTELNNPTIHKVQLKFTTSAMKRS